MGLKYKSKKNRYKVTRIKKSKVKTTRRKYSNKKRNTRKYKGGMPKKTKSLSEEEAESARIQINALPNLKSQKSSLPNSANVVGPDYEPSEIIKAIREKYEDTQERGLINYLINQRQGKLRAAEGSITFLEFPDAVNGRVPDNIVPIGILLKFVVVKDTTENYRLLYSVAHYPHVTWIEWFIKKYFDNELNFLGWPGRNVVLITPEMLLKIDDELIPYTGFGVLSTKTFTNFDIEVFITEYLIRNITVTDILTGEIRPFDPTKDSFIIESKELAHSSLPINSNIPNLEKNERGENSVFSASEGAVFSNGTLELDTSSGHYRPSYKQSVAVTKPLLESKGYTDLKVLVPPSDKQHYRAYFGNANLPEVRSLRDDVYNKRVYDAARQLLSSVKYIDPENEVTKQTQIVTATQEEDFSEFTSSRKNKIN
jgi:hypothetical protein